MTSTIGITLFTVCVIFGVILYQDNINDIRKSLSDEAEVISKSLNYYSGDYLEIVDGFVHESRVTVVASDGEILYDSAYDIEKMENHNNREEIQEARINGKGDAERTSNTLGIRMFYSAVLLDSGDVVRVAYSNVNVINDLLGLLIVGIVASIIVVMIVVLRARVITRQIIRPINQLDVEKPMENEIYEELKPLLMKIEENNKSKEDIANMRKEFSANVSHELKTPLTSISGYAELIKSGMVRSEDVPRFSEKIHTEAIRLVALVEDIIKISRLDEGRVELEKEEFNLFYLTREICSRLALQAEKRKVTIEISGELVKYFGIRAVVDEIIYNVCENAVKYNKQGGRVEIWVGNTLEGAKVIVRDTGIGIPVEEQERIFERFYRVDKSHSKETGGTGLGLSIVKHGAELHGIKIKLESEMNIGTKVQLLF